MSQDQLNDQLSRDALLQYLARRHERPVSLMDVQPFGSDETGEAALKLFGYGRPIKLTYRAGDTLYREVIHSARRNMFGRERDDDRAAAMWLDFHTFNDLPGHVPAVDLVALGGGRIWSIAVADSLHTITTFREGELYADDFVRLRHGGDESAGDQERAVALARYLAALHAQRLDDEWLWRRRLRDLVGDGEGFMGLTDSYPADFDLASPERLERLEARINAWRWRLKPHTERLCRVHGDFHPFNILFDSANRPILLDCSRGPWGAAADDVSCLSINFIFFSLQRSGRLEGPFERLHELFWHTYLDARPDPALPSFIQPWLAWRALVLASPVWYPTLDEGVRRRLFTFVDNVLASESYDWRHVNRYLALKER